MGSWKELKRSSAMLVLFVIVGSCGCVGAGQPAGDDSAAARVVPAGQPATIDGSFAEGEWTDAVEFTVDNAFTLYLKHADDVLYIGVKASERSVANVLIASGDDVRILHSSAALGTATYRRDGDLWRLVADFVWRCQAVEASPQAVAARERFLEDEGWLASNVFMGIPDELEYRIRWSDEFAAIAVLVVPISAPGAVASWPSDAGQSALPGPIPRQARFDVETWATISLEAEPRTLAFSSVRGSNGDIYLMSADGSDLRRVTTALAEELEPSWSPDGGQLAYQSRRPTWSLYTSLSDGADERALGTSVSWSPAWSPDGSRIAYSTGSSIRCVSVAEGEIDILVPSCGDCGRPAWSPDGREIAFHSSRAGSLDLYVLDVETRTSRQLTSGHGRDLHATWSPDGVSLAFASDRDGNLEIYTVRSDGTGVMRITDSPGDDMLPAWSPGGDRIAFVSSRDGNYEIYLMRPDGSDLRRLTDNPGDDMYPAWRPE
jgi:Tol biopolymer transport system component